MQSVLTERQWLDNCEALISEKPLSGKLRGPYMWKALIQEKGFAKCIWPLSWKSTEIPEDCVKQSTEVGPSLLYVNFYRVAEGRRGLPMRILSVCSSIRHSVCQTREL